MSEKPDDTYEMLDPSFHLKVSSRWMSLILFVLAASLAAAYGLWANLGTSKAIMQSQSEETPIRSSGQRSQDPSLIPAAQSPSSGTSFSGIAPKPFPKGSPSQGIVPMRETIYFDFNTAQASPAQLQRLKAFWMKVNAVPGQFKVEGHSDDAGAPEYNQWLSARRAEKVAQELQLLGMEQSYRVEGLGATQPVQSNQTERARALNRRVVISFEQTK